MIASYQALSATTKKRLEIFLFPLFLFVLNVIVKFCFLTSRDIALDEPFSIYYAQTDIPSIIQMLYSENNPPFHFFFLHYWVKLFGIGSFSVRLPSLIFSAFTAIVIYKIGKKFFNVVSGFAAALLFTFSTMHIFFSHEARVYPLFVMLTALSLYYYLSIIKTPENKTFYYLLFICNLLLIYSHYFGFFVLFVEVISLLFLPNTKAFIKPYFMMFVALGLSYIPNLFIFWHRFSTSTQNGTWVAAPAVTEYYGNLNRFINNRYNMVVVLLIGVCTLIYSYSNKTLLPKLKSLFQNSYFKIIVLWFIVPYTTMFLLSFKVPMFIDRYILYTSISFYLIIVIAIVALLEKASHQWMALSIFIGSLLITVQLNPDNNRRLKEVSDVVKNLKNENTITLLAPDYAYMGFAYHYNIDYFKDAPNTIADLNTDAVFPIHDVNQLNEVLKDTYSNCLYIQAGTEFSDPGNLILKEISKKYKFHKQVNIYQIYIIHQFYN